MNLEPKGKTRDMFTLAAWKKNNLKGESQEQSCPQTIFLWANFEHVRGQRFTSSQEKGNSSVCPTSILNSYILQLLITCNKLCNKRYVLELDGYTVIPATNYCMLMDH